MKNYKKIIVALELVLEKEQYLIDKVKALVEAGEGEIYAVHAVEHLGSYAASYAVSAGIDIEKLLLDEAKENMKKTAELLGINEEHQIIKLGPASQVILDVAEKIEPDIIIVGSHGKRGLRLLLGSTSNAVIHGAKDDVLAVRAPA